jgi:UDP:flavonoid glycosyltransferase YjiC (YdhE family)
MKQMLRHVWTYLYGQTEQHTYWVKFKRVQYNQRFPNFFFLACHVKVTLPSEERPKQLIYYAPSNYEQPYEWQIR